MLILLKFTAGAAVVTGGNVVGITPGGGVAMGTGVVVGISKLLC